MRIENRPIFDNSVDTLRNFAEEVYKVLKSISFGDVSNTSLAQNTDTCFINGVTDGVAGTEKVFAHTLGRVPTGFIIVFNDNGGVVYNGVTAWTTTQIYLKSTLNSTTFRAILL